MVQIKSFMKCKINNVSFLCMCKKQIGSYIYKNHLFYKYMIIYITRYVNNTTVAMFLKRVSPKYSVMINKGMFIWHIE